MKGTVYQTAEDTTLIDLVLAGERDAFRFLVERYQNLIYSLMMRQVGDPTVAQDLTQETFLKSFSALAQFERRANFKTWLTRIALNTASTYFQSRAYKSLRATEELHPETPSESERVDAPEDKERSLVALQQALGKLDPKYRDVIVLCKLEGKSYEEAASLLKISVGTVGSRLNVAQHQLRRLFWRIHK